MRLICPNCGAQYEVEDSVIPDDGRDVQCSNCGHTWFQRPAHLDQALADELNQDIATEDLEEDEVKTKEILDTAKPERERKVLDPKVTDVLREEAAREAAARRGDSTSLETQPDLGLDNTDERTASRSAAARSRMARMRGVDDSSPEAAAAALAAASASRRDLLPDIEEINSSLRAGHDRAESEAGSESEADTDSAKSAKQGRFRLGFVLAIVLAVIAVAIYVLAPTIIRTVPQTEPFLIAYVEYANIFRARLGAGIDMAITKIKDLIGGITGG